MIAEILKLPSVALIQGNGYVAVQKTYFQTHHKQCRPRSGGSPRVIVICLQY